MPSLLSLFYGAPLSTRRSLYEYNGGYRLDNGDFLYNLTSSQDFHLVSPTVASTSTAPISSHYYPSHPPSSQFSMRQEYSSAHTIQHNIIVGFLIGTIFVLAVALLILMGPPLFNYVKRKIPISKKRIDRRYDTIERWLISKRVRDHDVCQNTAVFMSRPSTTLFQDEEASTPDIVTLTSLNRSHAATRDEINKTVLAGRDGRSNSPSTLSKTHSDVTIPTVQTETSEPSNSSDVEPVVDEDSCSSDLEHGSAISASPLECSICLEPFSTNEVVSWSTNISCGHVFHHQCIKEWLLRRIDCPFCRKPMLSVDCKSPGKFSEEELSAMLGDWRNRMMSTYYCIKEGLVELDESADRINELTTDGKNLISPCVKREELVKMRRTHV